MSVATICPEPEQLQQLLLGQCDDSTADDLERHILSCPACTDALPIVNVDDNLVAAMRAPIANLPAEDCEAIESLTARLRERPHTGDTTTLGRTASGGLVSDAPLRLDFLEPAQASDEIGRLGSYRVIKVLGRGGMGIVFLAEDTKLHRTVAIKAMLPEIASQAKARERFLREARAAAQIEHDHIVTIHHVVDDRGGVPFLVMPLLKGESLEDWLLQREALAPGTHPAIAELLQIGREIAVGLAAAHARGLIHRDIKPGNIWLERKEEIGKTKSLPAESAGATTSFVAQPPSFRVKLLDFGLALPSQDETSLTHKGVIVGTPAYMAPEQAREEAKIDARADLWSLGVVLYRLATGELPFRGADTMGTLIQAACDEPPTPSGLNPSLPASLNDLILRLLSKDPKDRPASAEAVAAEIRRIERQIAEAAPSAPKQPRRPRWIVAAALLGLLAVALGGIIYVETDKGKIRIETIDDDVEILVERDGKVVRILDTKNRNETTLRSGEYTLRIGDKTKRVALDLKTVRITRGEKVIAHVTQVSGNASALPAVSGRGATFEDWLARVQKLPPAERIREMAAELKRRNPQFDGTIKHDFGKPGQTDLYICTDQILDISPLQALAKLPKLNLSLNGSAPGAGRLADLSALRGLPVVYLEVRCNPVTDLTPLQGLPLEQLYLTDTRVSELEPISGIQSLRVLHHSSDVAANLSPVWKMPLKSLWLGELEHAVTDEIRAHVRLMYGLEWINNRPAIAFWEQHDPKHAELLQWIAETIKLLPNKAKIEAVQAKMKEFNPKFDETKMKCEIKGGKIRLVEFNSDDVTNIVPLRAFHQLEELRCSGNWKFCKLADLSPLQGMNLNHLEIFGTQVSDLSPLRGMRLKFLWAGNTPVKDLTPLAGMPLEEVLIYASHVNDLTPLAWMPIRRLLVSDTPARDATPMGTMALTNISIVRGPRISTAFMRSLWSLQTIDEKPALEYWKKAQPEHAAYLQWIEQTRALPTEQQISAVEAMLKERNREFHGTIEPPKIFEGNVIAFTVPAEGIVDLSPIRAFPKLSALTCSGTKEHPSPLSDLAPLRGLKLDRLEMSFTGVKDLTPLRGLPLKTLRCTGSPVGDLSPLAHIRLESLDCDVDPDRDFTVLARIKTLQMLNGKPLKDVLK